MSLYDLLNEALAQNAGASFRSEDLGSYPEIFVDPIDPAPLETNGNDLIYGRGGSGKTIMVRALNDRIGKRFPDSRIISFSYDATTFRSSALATDSDPTAKDKAHVFFYSFIEKLALDIFNLTDDLLKAPKWLASLGLAGSAKARQRAKLAELVLDLLDASGYGTDFPLPGSTAISKGRRTSEHRESGRSSGVHAELTGSGAPFSIRASGGLGRNKKRTTDSETKVSYSVARHFSPSRIRELLGEIIDTAQLEYIVVFIDEWLSLDECQVEFAARLKQCLFNDSRIGVKIAADQYRDRFNNGIHGAHFRGFEIDRDIFVAVDLDLPFRDPDRSQALFAEALYNRLRHFVEGLEDHFGDNAFENPQRFIDSIFRTNRAFEELCVGAQGLCRDFLILFRDAAKQLDGRLSRSNRIDFEMVRRAITSRTARIYDRVGESMDAHTLLYRIISPHILNIRSPFFVLESSPDESRVIVNELLTKRVIHRVASETLHPSIRGRYQCYEISRAIFLDLMRAAEFSSEAPIEHTYDPREASAITDGDVSKYLLDLSALTQINARSARVYCPSCSREFSADEALFQARDICPLCFADVPTESSVSQPSRMATVDEEEMT